ncbi:hypothetical protein CBR_g38256 [Chara braunii]|uniref:Uncharacterized protein n=1 Tax=Chara braunii TaxID=69332 RepID=A0A388LPW5_CHABU|nr:hypothetical protein CBR_g38256 [Chara braunii]|eukprot:GBG84285.1 hypothetical protein CBR_g38256 [Chara braunii]
MSFLEERALSEASLAPRDRLTIRQVHHPRLSPDLRRLAHFFCTEGVYAAAVFRIEGRPDAVVLAEAVAVHQRAVPGVSRISVIINFSGDLSTLLPLQHSAVKASLRTWANDLIAEWTQLLARHGDTIATTRAIEYDGLRMYQRDPPTELPILVPFPLVGLRKGSRRTHPPPSQQRYLDPRTTLDPAFFRYPTAEQFAAIREEEEEEESTGSDEGEDGQEEGGDSDKVLAEEDETPEEGSYNENNEGEQSEEEEDEEGEEEHEEGPAGSEWKAVPKEALRTGTEAEDPEAGRKREEIAAGKELELASATSLHIHGDPNRDPEPPRPEDGDLAATTPTPSARRRSRSPSFPTRPPVRRRADTGDRSSSPITLSPTP